MTAGATSSRPSADRPAFWSHRWLLLSLVQRELRNRYAGTAGGLVWALLHPMLMLGIYAVVFQWVFQVRVPDAPAGQPYLLSVALTLWPWLAFSEALLRGSMAVQQHSALVKKVSFPNELLVYSSVCASLAVHAVGYLLVLLLLTLWGLDVHWQAWPVWLWAWGVLGLAALGMALILGALQVFLRDVEQLLGQCLTLFFYATPIIYPMALVPPALRQVMRANPLAHVLEAVRQTGLGQGWPSVAVWLGAPLAGALLCWAGHVWFRRLSPHFEDQL